MYPHAQKWYIRHYFQQSCHSHLRKLPKEQKKEQKRKKKSPKEQNSAITFKIMDNNSRKRSLESTLERREKRCRFDADFVMEPEDQVVEVKEAEETTETVPAIEDFFPNVSCAGYIQCMNSFHFVTNTLQGPQFGVSEVQAKLVKSLNQVGQAILACRVDQLNLQEFTTFWFLVHVICNDLQFLMPSNGIDEYDAQILIVLAHCFNSCAKLLGMVGWIDITDAELRDFRVPENRDLIYEMHEHMKKMYGNINTFFRNQPKAQRDQVRQGFQQLQHAERTFVTKH